MEMNNIFYALGIDAGGTLTRAVLIKFMDEHQLVIGISEKGSGNPASIGWDNALRNILDAALETIHQANISPPDVSVIGVSAAYTGWGKYVQRYVELFRKHFVNARIDVYHDIYASLLSCFPKGEGIVLIMGTGSSCLGVHEGRTVLVGGWGHLFNDKAGAYRVGRDGITAALEYYDGRGGETILLSLLMEYMGTNNIYDIIDHIYSSNDPKSIIAGFAPYVVKACRENDKIACSIIHSVAEDAVNHIWAAARRLGLSGAIEAGIVGGFYNGSKDLVEHLFKDIASRKRLNIIVKPQLVKPVCAVVYPGIARLTGLDPIDLALSAPNECKQIIK